MKKLFASIILITIISILIKVGYDMYKEANIKDYSQKNITSLIEENKTTQIKISTKNLKLVPEEYKGYKVSAKLKIPKLDIYTYVLENYSKDAMEVCVTKYFGGSPNEAGNYCIAGHNYITKNMFSKLGNLKIGDKLTLTDNIHGVVEYTIYDKYKAHPTQVETLSQKTNGQVEITLITCSDYSKKRIVIKARAGE